MKIAVLVSLMVLAAAGAGRVVHVFWAPAYTNEVEGVHVESDCEDWLAVKIEAQANGHALPFAEGQVDGRNPLLPAKIVNMDTYRVLRMTLRCGDIQGVFESPRQEFTMAR